jgi:hypothetical protein
MIVNLTLYSFSEQFTCTELFVAIRQLLSLDVATVTFQDTHNLAELFSYVLPAESRMIWPTPSFETLSTLESQLTLASLNRGCVPWPAILHVSSNQEREPFFSTHRGSMSSMHFGHVSVPVSFRFLLRLLTLSGENTVCVDFAPLSKMPEYR